MCALALLALLAAASAKLRSVDAQPLQSNQQSQPQSSPQQSGSQPAAQSDTQSDAQSDSSSDANSDLNSPPPVLPTDPPGWKPDPAPSNVPAAQTPAAKAVPAPSQPAAPAPAKTSDAPKPATVVAAAPAVPADIPLPADPRQRQVAVECNDLLHMAAGLKAAVDKSTKDELSIDVVRKAGEIEQYARKVRTGTQLAAGKQ
jgi:cytoskeletal protein RodZ